MNANSKTLVFYNPKNETPLILFGSCCLFWAGMSSSLILCFLLVGILVPRGGLCGESVGDEDLRGKELERAEKEHNTESWEETKGAVDPRAIDFDGDYQLVFLFLAL